MNDAGRTLQRLGRAAWPLVHRRWLAFWGGLERFLGSAGRGLSVMVTPAGTPYWAHFLLFLSVFLSWLTSPVQGGIKGRSASLFAFDVNLLYGVAKPWKPLSYGVVILGLLAFGWLSRRLGRRPRAYYTLMGVIVLFLVVSWLGSLALARPDALSGLVDQNAQLDRIKEFDNTHIHGNVGVIYIEPFSMEGLADTIWTLVNVTGFGAWFALLSAWAFLAKGRRCDTHPRRALILRAGIGVSAVFLLVLALPAVVADSLRARGDSAFRRGDYSEAVPSFRRAARLDTRFYDQDSFMLSLGQSAFRNGEGASPEAHYYLGTSYLDFLAYDSAQAEFEQGMAGLPPGDPARRAFRRALRDTFRLWGNLLYSQAELYGAIDKWEQAWSYDPDSVEMPYYLARAYYRVDGPNQARAIQVNQVLMKRVKDKIFRSDIYCNLGECYAREGRFADSRVNYEQSLDMYDFVKDINYRAQRGMIGL